MSPDLSKTHFLTMVSNPRRFSSRYRLYEQFKRHMIECELNFWTAEVAFGHRPFHVTTKCDPRNLQLRTHNELWIKERALTLLIAKLTVEHPDWEYVCWLDADIEFPNWRGDKAWYKETWHALQHHRVVQCFQHAIDLGPEGEHLHTHTGFAYSYAKDIPFKTGYTNGHPGYCWAARRETIEKTPLIDFAILGSGDRHMACGWIGQIDHSLNRRMSGPYWRKLHNWQEEAERWIRRDMGYVPGIILHHWHGRKKDRQYADRWKILVNDCFDPDRDIAADAYGLWRLVDHGDMRSIQLRDDIRKYFLARREDSIDLE